MIDQRNEFARAALYGMLAHPTRYKPRHIECHLHWHDAIASESYDIADAMIAAARGKWADQHTQGCASLEPSPMTREEIISIIREHYDPAPDWPRHRGWDDGAEQIADEILESFSRQQPVSNPAKLLDKCPKCGLDGSRGLHRFCTRGPSECPLR